MGHANKRLDVQMCFFNMNEASNDRDAASLQLMDDNKRPFLNIHISLSFCEDIEPLCLMFNLKL